MDSAKMITIGIGVLMVVSGSLNTIAAKWADSIKVDGRYFDHPFFQATCMFVGEFSCLIAFFIAYALKKYYWNRRRQQSNDNAIFDIQPDDEEEPQIPKFNPFIFLPPACCDVLGTSLMYIGLNLTTASSYQMLRGAVIIFTGLLSVAFLRMRLLGYKWLGMVLVMFGLVIVGLCDIFESGAGSDINAVITGDLLIIMAQIIVAIQMVTEQMFLERYDVPPLLAVGLEGLFGMIVLSTLMIPMYFIRVPETFSNDPEHRLENVFLAFPRSLRQARYCSSSYIAFFNFAGVSVTKRLSATTRMVLDSVRTLIIWIFSIPLFGERFIPQQLFGFGFLILGMFVYNDLFFGPRFRRDIFPKIRNVSVAQWFASFCGTELDDFQDEEPLVINSDEENQEP
ncbi:UAA transporter family protein [Aphelenchoides bicaudatus]|nr:UAA transporter family protein [Aphelenchoides bicaudatus]